MDETHRTYSLSPSIVAALLGDRTAPLERTSSAMDPADLILTDQSAKIKTASREEFYSFPTSSVVAQRPDYECPSKNKKTAT